MLAEGAVIAVWCYGLIEIHEEVDDIVRRLYEQTLGPFWSPERRLVEEGYRTIEFPFAEFALPPVAIERKLTLEELGAYLRTWSATQRYVRERGADPVAPVLIELASVWGDPTRTRRGRWPLSIRAGWRG